MRGSARVPTITDVYELTADVGTFRKRRPEKKPARQAPPRRSARPFCGPQAARMRSGLVGKKRRLAGCAPPPGRRAASAQTRGAQRGRMPAPATVGGRQRASQSRSSSTTSAVRRDKRHPLDAADARHRGCRGNRYEIEVQCSSRAACDDEQLAGAEHQGVLSGLSSPRSPRRPSRGVPPTGISEGRRGCRRFSITNKLR